MMPGKKLGGDFSGCIVADKSGRVDRGISISISNCDLVGDSRRDSGDRNLIRKENLDGSETKKSSGLDNIGVIGNGNGPSLGQPDLIVPGMRKFEANNNTSTTHVEECIGPTNSDTDIRKKNGDNGRRVGQWKKVARNNSGGIMRSNQEVASGKRKDVVMFDSFMEGNKKPKYDSSLSGSNVTSVGQ
ncbi:hypothetical protein Q3G72_002941 [Acer saccharum]|nr:hypothetical protein Q3G72_002941 [Acer saccharum]